MGNCCVNTSADKSSDLQVQQEGVKMGMDESFDTYDKTVPQTPQGEEETKSNMGRKQSTKPDSEAATSNRN